MTTELVHVVVVVVVVPLEGSHACCVSHNVFISSQVVQILCTRTFQLTSSSNRSRMMGSIVAAAVVVVVFVVRSSGSNNWTRSSLEISNIAVLHGFNSTGGDNGRNAVEVDDEDEDAIVAEVGMMVHVAIVMSRESLADESFMVQLCMSIFFVEDIPLRRSIYMCFWLLANCSELLS